MPCHCRTADRRAGFLAPALAAALAILLLVAAVVLNVAWRRTAERQLATAADAAALAAAAELACDERLLDGPLSDSTLARVRRRVEELSARHSILGVPALPIADTTSIGRQVIVGNDDVMLLETDHHPAAVRVTVQRGRTGYFPWLLRAGGHHGARLTATAEAAIDNRVVSLRPRAGGPVPIWPLAVREKAASESETASNTPGWRDQIEDGLGSDLFSFDGEARRVVRQSDGLPELVVRTPARDGDADEAGLVLIDLGQSFRIDRLDRVMTDGFDPNDLHRLGGQVPVATLATSPMDVPVLSQLPREIEQRLAPGAVRAIFLFEPLSAGRSGRSYARLTRVVAARLMDLTPIAGGGWQATFQPAVLATGIAVLADADDTTAVESRYLYRVRLTR